MPKKKDPQEQQQEPLYDLYDGLHHTLRLGAVTLERIQQWYDDWYGLGPGAVDIIPSSSGSYYDIDGFLVTAKKTGKEVGFIVPQSTPIESGLHVPEDIVKFGNPGYVPPEVKNLKGKAPKGM